MNDDETELSTAGKTGDGVVLIYTTFPLQSQAHSMGRQLVEAGLAACVNIFPGMTSVYIWKGKVEETGETAMIVKTARSRANEILDRIKRQHPYDTPTRLVLPVADGGRDFLDWIMAQSTHRR